MSLVRGSGIFVAAMLLAGCVKAPLLPVGDSAESSIIFVADPQLHNMYGVGLKQMLPAADLVSNVAIRPPELNLLAPHVLRELITQAKQQAPKNSLVVVVGDLTNIACTGEFDDFVGVMDAAWSGGLWLAAHGNHDTYLMGTANTYTPLDDVKGWRPANMPRSDLPTDESWWGPQIAPKGARNWRDGCYRPHDEHSAPMNKVRWLARYFAHLQKHGLKTEPVADDGGPIPLNFTATSGLLGELKFQVRGMWLKPRFGPKPSQTDFLRSYSSFIVQTADVTPRHHLVIIDTALCTYAPGGPKFALLNAGSRACVGRDQLAIIDQIVKETDGTRGLILVGHFPLKDFSPEEREEFLQIVSRAKQWTYVSAQSHDEKSASDWVTGTEFNIGSTTDWPMEAHRFHPAADSGAFGSRRSFTLSTYADEIGYVPSAPYSGTEVCRHLPVAAALANLDVKTLPRPWRSPASHYGCDPFDGDEGTWKARGERLHYYIRRIASRMSQSDYREAVLKIAAAASRHEESRFGLHRLLPW